MIRKTLASAMKTKKFDFNLESSVVTKNGAGDCIIEGYANTSSKDRVGEVVMPKAFEKTLKTYMSNPVLLVNHDWNDPCGVVQDSKITDKGLWIKARVSNTREDIKTLIREGCLRTFSIGYNEVDCDYDESTKTKYIKELELLEISIVTVPANTEAMFTEATAKTEEAPKVTETADESAKSAPSSRSAKELSDFIQTVKSVISRDLTSTETVAVCDYFINEKEKPMTKEQLVAALSKSAPATAPASEEAKGDQAGKPAAEGGSDPLKELAAKIDAMAQGMAQMLEMMQAMAQPQDGEKPADEKPADEEKKDEKPEDKEEGKEEDAKDPEQKPEDEEEQKADDQQEEDMSDDDCEKELHELEAQIAEFEDSEGL